MIHSGVIVEQLLSI